MNDQVLWYATRGAGMMSLILLSTVVVLGILSHARFGTRSWPRFVTPALHRNLSLLAVVIVTIHVVTAITDPFTHLGVVAAVVPFGSYYRTFWLGLGTLSGELALAVIATSLVRPWLGRFTWKAIHFSSYPLWIMAVAHSLGTGSDASAMWMEAIAVLCVAGVTGATAWRVLIFAGDPVGLGRGQARRNFGGTAQ